MTGFASPWAFLLFLPLAFSAYRMLRRRPGSGVRFPLVSALPVRTSWRQRLTLLPPVLLLAGMACGIVALARPRTEFSKVRETKDAVAIEMSIDVSGSMTALDLSPATERKTRLDVVKDTFREFVDKRPDDLIGLVAFGGYATTRCPLTFDHEALVRVLEATEVPGSDGSAVDREETLTAIGDGLAMACARLASATNVASRIAILLSDGVSNFGIITPEQATALARQQKVKVYVIGVGSNGRGLVPALWHDERGREVIERAMAEMDEPALRRIAEQTGGNYYNVRSEGALEKALAEIDKLEKTSVEETVYRRWNENYPPWLAACLALCALALLLASSSRRGLF